tara:strand:+ start:3591 stop:5009 length:1419 start_codon:yes stop_codon:yes gene_type:complete
MAKKQAINYNPNTALIQGAAAIGMSMMPADLSGLDKITETGISMMEQAKKERKELEDMLNKAADKVLAKAGGLGEEMYNYSLNKIQRYKDDYLRGQKIGGAEGDKIKRIAMNNMAQWANFASEHQELNVVSAENRLEGNMVKNLTKDEAIILGNIHDEKYTVGENNEGIMVYNMDVNGKNTQVTYERYKELAARVKNPKLANTFITTKNAFEKNEDFNRDEFKHIIKQDISNKEQSFVDGLYEDFMGQTFYEKLLEDKSIANEAMIAIANADPNDNITLQNYNKAEIKADIIAAVTDPENPAFNLERSMDIMADKLTDMAANSHKTKWDKIAQKEQTALNRQLEAQGKTIYMPAVGNYVNRELVDDDVAIINEDRKDFPIRTSYNNVQFRRVGGVYQVKDKNNKFIDVTLDELLATLQFDEKHGIQRPKVKKFNRDQGIVAEEVRKKQTENLIEAATPDLTNKTKTPLKSND